MVTAEAQ